MDWFWKEIQKRFESKHRGRIGPAPGDQKAMRIFNRVVEWIDDQRHVEICIKDLGIDHNSCSVATPIDKREKLEKEES